MSSIYWKTEPYQKKLSKEIQWIDSPHPSKKFGKANPKERFFDVMEELGKPTSIDRRPGGLAIWNKATLMERGHCWERVELRDEQIPHLDPAPHVDFLYYHFKLNIPAEKLQDILELSSSVYYDRLKREIVARCHTPSASIATIYLAMLVATGKMSGKEAKARYGEYVMSTFPGTKFYKKNARKMMENEICKYYYGRQRYRVLNKNKVVMNRNNFYWKDHSTVLYKKIYENDREDFSQREYISGYAALGGLDNSGGICTIL